MRTFARWATAALLAVLVVLGTAARTPEAALAHTTVDVADGQYAVELGFLNEPALQGQPNAVYVKVSKFGSGGAAPVDGLAGSLTAEVDKDGKSMSLPLLPMGNGEYQGIFYPTALGDYTFRIGGAIDGNPVAVEASSSTTTFSPVEPVSNLQFPDPAPSSDELAAELARGQADAALARTLGIAGLAVGVVALALGIAALIRSRPKAG